MRLLSATLFLGLLTTLGCGPREQFCTDGLDDDGDGKIDCDDSDCDAAENWCVDNDGDGYREFDGDCWDGEELTHPDSGEIVLDFDDNPIMGVDIHPGAEDICNGISDDCDDEEDEDAEELTWYQDSDKDGHGDASVKSFSCRTDRELWSEYDDDCDDLDGDTYPGADELCDDKDNDCDEEIDEDPADPPMWYVDDDGDGYGDAATSMGACDQPDGYADNDEDCDDSDDGANPDGIEQLGLGDRDCNGVSGDAELGASMTGGTYQMGSRSSDLGRFDNEDQVSVTLTGTYVAGVYEVTQAQFEALLGYNPSSFPGCDDCPVDTVGWHEAALFANAVSEASGLDTCYDCTGMASTLECDPSAIPYNCEGYRLPTEAEWEHMARSGSTDAFISGGNLGSTDDTSSCSSSLTLDDGSAIVDLGWYCANSDQGSGAMPQPVGQLEANNRDLYDVHGNVSEWCHDRFQSQLPGGNDPVVVSGSGRVYRGGSFVDIPRSLRLSYRGQGSEDYTFEYTGVRLVRSN